MNQVPLHIPDHKMAKVFGVFPGELDDFMTLFQRDVALGQELGNHIRLTTSAGMSESSSTDGSTMIYTRIIRLIQTVGTSED
jgi:hypothetical protein